MTATADAFGLGADLDAALGGGRRLWGTVERGEAGGIVRISFTVPGAPKTWQRARKGKYGPLFTPADRESKMAEIRDAWRSLAVPPFARDIFFRLGVCVFIERPGSHYGTGKNANVLKPSAPARPGSGRYGGDLSNFVKLVEDALNGVAYHDDAQICGWLSPSEKFFADAVANEMPRTEVVMEPLSPVDLAVVGGQPTLIAGS